MLILVHITFGSRWGIVAIITYKGDNSKSYVPECYRRATYDNYYGQVISPINGIIHSSILSKTNDILKLR